MSEFEYVTERSHQAIREMFGEGHEGMLEAHYQRWAARVDPDWARIVSGLIIEGLYSRQVLTTAQRELCAVAALTVLLRTEELERHLDIALNSNPMEQVREVIIQMSVYAGMPVVLTAMDQFEKVLARRAEREAPSA